MRLLKKKGGGGGVRELIIPEQLTPRPREDTSRKQLLTKDVALQWIQAVTGLVAWAVDADEDECVRAVEEVRESVHASDPSKRVRRFMDSIGVDMAAAIVLEGRPASIA